MQYTVQQQRITDALDALGNTPEAVAHSLFEAGVCGVPGDSAACPVANYLREELSDLGADVRVHAVSARVNYLMGEHRAEWTGGLPGAVTAFIRRFDHGGYDALDSANRPWQEDA